MSFSFRRKPDLEAAQQRIDSEFTRKADMARQAGKPEPAPMPYVRPADLYAFRVKYRLSARMAGGFIDRSDTWWLWREQGVYLMPPDLFEMAKAAAAKTPPQNAEPEPVTKAGLAARVQLLESQAQDHAAQLRELRWAMRRLDPAAQCDTARQPGASHCDLL